MAYTVGDVSKMAHVSVRTLHHYDELGLVKPSSRTEAGYRLYTPRDLERLQQVLFHRELGFSLEDIARMLADPAFDRRRALMTQRSLLAERAEQARALVDLIDKTIDALDQGEPMSHEDMFNGFDPTQYEEEAKERWGGSAEYEESIKRTRRYTREDWKRLGVEAGAIHEGFAQAMDAMVPPTDARAMDLAERHRQHISRWFYPCSFEIHTGLGQMYVADPRFAANYEPIRTGMAQYICDAIRANAERSSRDSGGKA
jgi:MerR family transcriptional regulator, thiopeptide resistance regulator